MHWTRVVQLVAICAAVSPLAAGTVHTRFQCDHLANSTADRASHPDDHSAVLAQLDASRASHVAVRSGDWSDPGTWSSGVPTAGARVVIPQDVTVTVKAPIGVAALDWVRVEG